MNFYGHIPVSFFWFHLVAIYLLQGIIFTLEWNLGLKKGIIFYSPFPQEPVYDQVKKGSWELWETFSTIENLWKAESMIHLPR